MEGMATVAGEDMHHMFWAEEDRFTTRRLVYCSQHIPTGRRGGNIEDVTGWCRGIDIGDSKSCTHRPF